VLRIGGIGEEHVAPTGLRLDVTHVHHAIREAREEDERLDVALSPRRDDVVGDLPVSLVGVGERDDHVVGGGGAGNQREERDRPEDPEHADAARLERDELAVRRQAAQAQQDPVQQRHRNRDAQRLRDQRQQDAQDDRPRHALGDQPLGVQQDGRHHQHEGEADQRQERRRHDFAHEIPVERLQRY
jgi:hypothetical protein